MPTPAIIQKVRDLRKQIAETPDLPTHVQPDASAIQQQIDTIMLQPDHVPHYTSLNDRLLLAYVKFQVDHPKLAAAMIDLQSALAAAGSCPESLLKTTIYVVAAERSDLLRVWDVVAERLGRAPSTLLGVSFLGYPDQLVEIEAVAAVRPT